MRGILGVVAMALALAGCASIDGYPRQAVDTSADLEKLKGTYDATALEKYVKATNESARRPLRDQIVYGRLLAYDAAFATFERQLAGEGNLWNVGGSFAGTVLDTGSTLAKSARTKTRLSAYGLGLSAFQTDTSKQLFYEKTLPAVLAQMKADRIKARLPIEQGLAKTDAEYSLMKALVDLKGYENAGSIASAVSSISQSAENETDKTEAKIAAIRTVSFTCDTYCERIKAWGYDKSAKKWDAQKLKDMRAQLKALGVNEPLAEVINSNDRPSYAGARAMIVARLNVPEVTPQEEPEAPPSEEDPQEPQQ